MTIQYEDLVNPRVTTALGTSRSGQKPFRGLLPTGLEQLTFPRSRGLKIDIRNNFGRKLGSYSTEGGKKEVVSVEFELTENGCGGGTIELSEFPPYPVKLGYTVDVYIYGDPVPWYSGLVTESPDPHSVAPESNYQLVTFGFYELLDKVILNQTGKQTAVFADTEICTIVHHLASAFVGPALGVNIDDSKIEQTPPGNPATVDFHLATAKKAFTDLANLAQDFTFGVDSRRDFFFKKRRKIASNIGAAFPTRHIKELQVSNDSGTIENLLVIKERGEGNQRQRPPVIVEDKDSQRKYGIRGKTKNMPTFVGTVDVKRWGSWYLDQHARPEKKIEVEITDIGTQPIVPGDTMRVHSRVVSFNYNDEFYGVSEFDPKWTMVETSGGRFTLDHTAATFASSWMSCIPATVSEPLYSGGDTDWVHHVPKILQTVTGDFLAETEVMLSPHPSYSSPFINMGIWVGESPKRWCTNRIENWADTYHWMHWRDDFIHEYFPNPNRLTRVRSADLRTLTGSPSETDIRSIDTTGFGLRVSRENGRIRTWYKTQSNTMFGADPVWVEIDPWNYSYMSPVFSSVRDLDIGLFCGVAPGFENGTPPGKSNTLIAHFKYFRLETNAVYFELPVRQVEYKISNEGMQTKVGLGDSADAFAGAGKSLKEVFEEVELSGKYESLRAHDRNDWAMHYLYNR